MKIQHLLSLALFGFLLSSVELNAEEADMDSKAVAGYASAGMPMTTAEDDLEDEEMNQKKKTP